LEEEKERIMRHVREIKAKSKAKSFQSLFHRIRYEQRFREILASLEKENIHSREILPSSFPDQQMVEYSPDFVVWKENVSIPLFLTESRSRKRYTITRSEMDGFVKYLTKTGFYETAVSWMTSDDFPCKIFHVNELNRLLRTRKKTFSFEEVLPFEQTIRQYIKKESPEWPVMELVDFPQLERPERLVNTLKLTLEEAFYRELGRRRPRLPHKQKALKGVSEKDLATLNMLIQRYFQGQINEDDLVSYLRNLSKRRGVEN